MTCGIYFYWDNKKDELAYIGQSINCERRHRQHLTKKNGGIRFDKILQNNPNRYNFYIMLHCRNHELDKQEKIAIKLYKPKFNFTPGGSGIGSGVHHPFYGKKRPEFSKKISGKNNPMYNKKDQMYLYVTLKT